MAVVGMETLGGYGRLNPPSLRSCRMSGAWASSEGGTCIQGAPSCAEPLKRNISFVMVDLCFFELGSMAKLF